MKKALSLTYVLYEDGDLVGKLLAYATLSPVAIVVALITLIVFQRQWRSVVFLLGLSVNHLLCIVLKRILAEERPSGSDREDFGMPSNHGQFMGFFTVYTLSLLHTVPSQFRGIKWLVTFALIIGMIIVAYSRIYLGYHTFTQVAVGLSIGSTLARFWPKVLHDKIL
eukprot:TRINITY_DN13034_c0_g1_i1.p1 TRINITY_DN13034_c0_g1~~TRINITY_DN13034_c0_g1_i1.p1  ORF type:complete len:167 (+),score=26.62 TRINITY_DN13034_c0_g1_i1:107-607(+)